MKKVDFKLKDTGKEYWVTPVSTAANEICKHCKGVYMKSFLMQYHLLDNFIEFYNKLWKMHLIIEIDGVEIKT
jgi:hypothetical protein